MTSARLQVWQVEASEATSTALKQSSSVTQSTAKVMSTLDFAVLENLENEEN